MSSEEWQTLLSNNDLNNVTLRDARYDQVIHLVSLLFFLYWGYFLQNAFLDC